MPCVVHFMGVSIMRQELFALAHRINLNDDKWQKKYLISLIETAFLYERNNTFSDTQALKAFLKREDILSFEIFHHEWESCISQLLSLKKLVKLHPGGWKMTESRINELKGEVNEWMKLEEKVKKDWLCQVSEKYSSVSEDEKNLLWISLRDRFILKLFLRHGAETAKIIFGQNAVGDDYFSASIEGLLNESTSNISKKLQAIAQEEFPLFFDPNNDSIRKYLNSYFRCNL